ncbi:MAG: isopentenyl phosphate kinase family protein [Thermoplasmata archaeon]|nr:isopentenyl phosphate kinase family protein [Thermoplasmata archaeon]
MTGEPPVVIKLGGSVITRKQGAARVRPKVLGRLAEELVVDGPPRIVLHGAGSFGHPGAARWGLASPPNEKAPGRDRSRGAAIVSAEVRKLHSTVLKAMVDAGGSPFSLPAAGLAANQGGRLARFEPSPFREALALGAMPVSFGDVVLDESWGFSILSADTIAVELARALHARSVVFVSDVPGVFERFDGGRGRIIERLTPSVVGDLSPAAGDRDVTGGIRGKVEAMLAIAELGADAGLISGLTDGALARAIRGEAVYGSWARARSP